MIIKPQNTKLPLNMGHNSTDVLLITGRNVYAKSGVKELIASNRRFRHKASVPTLKDYADLKEFLHDTPWGLNCKLIVGVGGGTSLDVAKYSRTTMFDDEVPLLLVPTTIGSGAECTGSAVIYDEDGTKSSVEVNRAEYIAYVPELLQSMPDNVMISSILDMGAQAIESMWSRKSTMESRTFAIAALDTFRKAVDFIINGKDPRDDIEALQDLQAAAANAGRAIDITHTTLAHALSYNLTWEHGISHGYAVWATLPEVIRYNIDNGYEFPDNAFTHKPPGPKAIKDIVQYAEDVRQKLIPTHIRAHIKNSTQQSLTRNEMRVNQRRLNNNPLNVTESTVIQILKEATYKLILN